MGVGTDSSAVGVTLRAATLAALKLVHTFAWFSIESCMVYVLWAGFRRRSDRRVAVAAGVVATESLVFAANGFRCPLTQAAEHVGAERGSVTDIYLPRWFARNLPAIHVPLIMLAGYLHGRNLRRASIVAGGGKSLPARGGGRALGGVGGRGCSSAWRGDVSSVRMGSAASNGRAVRPDAVEAGLSKLDEHEVDG